MTKRVYISADYSENSGDRDIVNILNKWGKDDLHKINFIDTAKVASGSVSNNRDCRICDLKKEFNKQINASSVVIFIIGDKTASRTAGSQCLRMENEFYCTPYKENSNGRKRCKYESVTYSNPNEDIGYINSCSYLEHEFKQSIRKNKKIIIIYNSMRRETSWLPDYMKKYESIATPFYINREGIKYENYPFIKKELEY